MLIQHEPNLTAQQKHDALIEHTREAVAALPQRWQEFIWRYRADIEGRGRATGVGSAVLYGQFVADVTARVQADAAERPIAEPAAPVEKVAGVISQSMHV
jgi:hypothetical protein